MLTTAINLFFLLWLQKHRPLPLRTLPAAKYHYRRECLPAVLTPTNSTDDEEEGDEEAEGDDKEDDITTAQFSFRKAINFSDARQPQQGQKCPGLVLDTTMDLDDRRAAPLPADVNGDNLSPWPASAQSHDGIQPSPIPHCLVSQSLILSGGRTATPIYDHFAYFTASPSLEVMMSDADQPSAPEAFEANVPASDGPSDVAAWWRRRRLPSPISEDEAHGYRGASPFPLSVELRGGRLEKREEPPDVLATMHSSTTLATGSNENDAQFSAAGGLARKNGKVLISMGFRADCDKCRRKVPGHYSHIIRS